MLWLCSRKRSLLGSVSLFLLYSTFGMPRNRKGTVTVTHTERARGDKQFSHAGKIFGDFAFSLSAEKLILGRQFKFVCACKFQVRKQERKEQGASERANERKRVQNIIQCEQNIEKLEQRHTLTHTWTKESKRKIIFVLHIALDLKTTRKNIRKSSDLNASILHSYYEYRQLRERVSVQPNHL